MPDAINLALKLNLFDEHWSPRIIAGYNGNDVMVVKVQGEFRWHSHPETDDFFLVLKGKLTIRMRDGDVVLGRARCTSCRAAWNTLQWRRKRRICC